MAQYGFKLKVESNIDELEALIAELKAVFDKINCFEVKMQFGQDDSDPSESSES